MTETTALSLPQRESFSQFLPQNVRDLAWVANEVAKAQLYKIGPRAMTGNEVFVVMMKGAELGLSPMQSLAEISLIKGKPFVSKDVLVARILRSPRCSDWDPSDMDEKHCTIRFRVRGNSKEHVVSTHIDDIPKRYFQPSSTGEPSNWTLIPEDMLFAWTVRRIARRWFPEALLDIGDGRADVDESRVIDVAAVEREVAPTEEGYFGLHTNCGGKLWLKEARTGGAFLLCDKCGDTNAPPQAVRDLIRGTPPGLTIAAQTGETVEETEEQPPPEVPVDAAANGGGLAPGEREMTTEEAASFALEPETPADGTSPREGRISALQAFLEAQRASASLEQKQRTRDALLAAGWDGRMGVPAMLGAMSDSTLELLERELLKVPA